MSDKVQLSGTVRSMTELAVRFRVGVYQADEDARRAASLLLWFPIRISYLHRAEDGQQVLTVPRAFLRKKIAGGRPAQAGHEKESRVA